MEAISPQCLEMGVEGSLVEAGDRLHALSGWSAGVTAASSQCLKVAIADS